MTTHSPGACPMYALPTLHRPKLIHKLHKLWSPPWSTMHHHPSPPFNGSHHQSLSHLVDIFKQTTEPKSQAYTKPMLVEPLPLTAYPSRSPPPLKMPKLSGLQPTPTNAPPRVPHYAPPRVTVYLVSSFGAWLALLRVTCLYLVPSIESQTVPPTVPPETPTISPLKLHCYLLTSWKKTPNMTCPVSPGVPCFQRTGNLDHIWRLGSKKLNKNSF